MARNKMIYGNVYLYTNVTGFGGTAPYGGTYLGFTASGIDFDAGITLVADTVGDHVAIDDIRDMGAAPSASCVLLEWNKVNIQNQFNNGRVVDLGGDKFRIDFPGTVVPGRPITQHNLLMVPEDPLGETAIFFPAMKVLPTHSGITLSLGTRVVLPVEFIALYKAIAVGATGYAQRQCQVGPLANLIFC